jgi:hypothetical protein
MTGGNTAKGVQKRTPSPTVPADMVSVAVEGPLSKVKTWYSAIGRSTLGALRQHRDQDGPVFRLI